MDFELTEAQQNVRQLVHWLAKERIRPLSLEADANHTWPNEFLLELPATQRSPEPVLHAVGTDGHAGFEERSKGSLEPGKLADLIVLDRDPFEIPIDELKDVKVDTTIVGLVVPPGETYPPDPPVVPPGVPCSHWVLPLASLTTVVHALTSPSRSSKARPHLETST